VRESYAYISDFDGGLRIIDVSSPTNPVEVGYYYAPTFFALNCFFSDPFIYVAAACLGLQIYEFYGTSIEEKEQKSESSPMTLRLLQNPVTGRSIPLMLLTNNLNNCAFGLYNTLGQQVETFYLENLSIGKNNVDLPINDIPSGIYFLKLKNDPSVPPEKVVILK
jgi:hypothetical protein